MPLEAFKCPQCGANLQVNISDRTFYCAYCGTKLKINVLKEIILPATEAPPILAEADNKQTVQLWLDIMMPIISESEMLLGSLGEFSTAEKLSAILKTVKLNYKKTAAVATPECLLAAREYFLTGLALYKQSLESFLNGNLESGRLLYKRALPKMEALKSELARVRVFRLWGGKA